MPLILSLFDNPAFPVLADLLEVPKERRDAFFWHVVGIQDFVNPPDGMVANGVRKGNAAFEKAEGHVRGLLAALEEIGRAGDAQLFVDAVHFNCEHRIGFGKYEPPEPPPDAAEAVFDDRPGDYKFVFAGIGKILSVALHSTAVALADLTGRNPVGRVKLDPAAEATESSSSAIAILLNSRMDYGPRVPNWQLHAVLHDIRTWPERFGATVTGHRSATLAKAIGLLHEIMPGIVPERIPSSTIKTIWKQRPRKGNRRKR